jgi:hypothetical protein
MGISECPAGERENLAQYEFQGYNRFWQCVRGQISTTTPAKAKQRLKERGLFFVTVWRYGGDPWWWAGNVQYVKFLCTSRLAYRDDNVVLYRQRKLLHLLFGLLFLTIEASEKLPTVRVVG